MIYTTTFRQRAVREYLEAIKLYNERSTQVAENFRTEIENIIQKIEKQPDYFRASFKQFHEAKIRRYPYNIVYFVDEQIGRIVIISIFHSKRDPNLKYKP